MDPRVVLTSVFLLPEPVHQIDRCQALALALRKVGVPVTLSQVHRTTFLLTAGRALLRAF